jgi:anti-sigma factor RsiW
MSTNAGTALEAAPPPEDEHQMVGAYTLDALDEPERAEFEEHLAGCPLCSADVPAFREVLADLAWSASSPPPADLVRQTLRRAHGLSQEPPARRGFWGRILRRPR